MELPRKEETHGKWDGSLTLAVGVDEAQEDGKQKSAVQQDSGQVGQLSTEVAAVEKKKEKPVDTGRQVIEQVTVGTESAIKTDEILSADEEIPADCKLLSIEGYLNGISVVFLVESGASECLCVKHLLRRMD